jgi:hypothetical protein
MQLIKNRFSAIFQKIPATKSGRMKGAGHVARMGDKRVAYKVLVGRPEGKRRFGRPRRRWG